MRQSQESEVREVVRAAGSPSEALRSLSPAVFTAYQRFVQKECDEAELERALLEWPLGWWQDTTQRARECSRCPQHGGECRKSDLYVRLGKQPRWRKIGKRWAVDEVECDRWNEAEVRERLSDAGVPAAYGNSTLDEASPILVLADKLTNRSLSTLVIEGRNRRIMAAGLARYFVDQDHYVHFRYVLIDGYMERLIRNSWNNRNNEENPLLELYEHPLLIVDAFHEDTSRAVDIEVRSLIKARQHNRRLTVVVCESAKRSEIDGPVVGGE